MDSEYAEEGRNGQDEYAVEYNENEGNGEDFREADDERHHQEERGHHQEERDDDEDHEHDEYDDHGPDDADDDRKLFVGGLTWDTTDKDLKEYFCQFGPVLKAELKVDQISGRSRGFAFVTFKDSESKKNVCACREHKLNGKRIDPKAAKPRGKDPVRKVFVGGIDHHIKDEDIREHFEQNFGPVTDIERPRNKKFCFITFDKEEHAKSAMADSKQTICDCMCDVNEATPKEDHRGGPPGGPGGRGGRGGWGGPHGGYDDGYYGPPNGPPRGGPRGRGHRGGRGGGPPHGWNDGYGGDDYYDQGQDYNYDYSQQGYDPSWNNYNYQDYYNSYYNYDPNYYANWYGQGYDQSTAADWNAYWNSQQYYNDYYKNYYAQQGQTQDATQQQPQQPAAPAVDQTPAASPSEEDSSGGYPNKSRGRGRGRFHPYQQSSE